ncbi:MAG: oligoendopeptidase F [Alkalispirochaeta sp.]
MNTIPARNEIPTHDRWDLSKLYSNDEAWEADLDHLIEQEEAILSFQGRLHESAKTLLDYLTLSVDIGKLEERLGYYAMLRKSEDAGDSENQSRFGRFMQIASRIGAAMSFFAPELQQIPESDMKQLLTDSRLQEHRISLDRVLRYRPHTLSPSEEKLLAMQEEPNQTASKTFGALVDVDLEFGTIQTPEGERTLSQSSLGSLLEHADRDVRRRVFDQFYQHFDQHKNTLASLLSGSVQLDVYRAQVRNFSSSLESCLFPDNVPVSVYDNLINTVREHTPLLHRYYDLRKRVLDLPDLAAYDTRVSLVPEVAVKHTFEEAVDTTIHALSPLGEEYTTTLREGLLNGWVDRYENKGKRSGAFSAGSFVGDPYILMNYKENTIRDVFTLAHEAGHSMHSWYSARSNPFQHYDYTIFEAEVASTFNEQLLMYHLLGKHRESPMHTYLLSKQLDDIAATLFRQTMFAEFERVIHDRVEQGQALTVDSLRADYKTLLDAYFGNSVYLPDALSLEGLRIPHFYRAFYVYKYATGISAAITLSQRVLNGGATEREEYFAFLKSGGSQFPIESLRLAGVDMHHPQPIRSAMAVFKTRLDELEHALIT